MKVISIIFILVILTGCGTKQIRQDQKDNYALQLTAWTQQQTALSNITSAVVASCQKDANPGLCVNEALEEFAEGKSAMPQPQSPYVSPAARIGLAVVNTVNSGLGLYAGYKRDQNMGAWLETVSSNAGTHVQGDFINGAQDNSTDDSVAVGGNLGNTYGNDYTGGSRFGNDYTGGNRSDTQFNGSGPVLIDSAGATVGNQNGNTGNMGTSNQQTSDGDNCDGESCIELPPVEEAPVEEGAGV